MIDERNFFDQPVKNDLKTGNLKTTFKKLLLVKVMITELVVYRIFLISKNITS